MCLQLRLRRKHDRDEASSLQAHQLSTTTSTRKPTRTASSPASRQSTVSERSRSRLPIALAHSHESFCESTTTHKNNNANSDRVLLPKRMLDRPRPVSQRPCLFDSRHIDTLDKLDLKSAESLTAGDGCQAERKIDGHFRILDLPAELREYIFELAILHQQYSPSIEVALPDAGFVRPPHDIHQAGVLIKHQLDRQLLRSKRPDRPAMTLVCKQFRRESLPLYLQERTMLLTLKNVPHALATPELRNQNSMRVSWPMQYSGKRKRFAILLPRRGSQCRPLLWVGPGGDGEYEVVVWQCFWTLRSSRFVQEWRGRRAPAATIDRVRQSVASNGGELLLEDIARLCLEFCSYWQSGVLNVA